MNNDSIFQIEEGKCILNGGDCARPQCRLCIIPVLMKDDATAFMEARTRIREKV